MLHRFVAGKTNIVILCGEPQGLDMPPCDIVVVMDEIQGLSHFMKVKNMAKSMTGKLVLLIDKSDQLAYERQINQFGLEVKELQKVRYLIPTHFFFFFNNLFFFKRKKNKKESIFDITATFPFR